MDRPGFSLVQYRHRGRYYLENEPLEVHPHSLGDNIVRTLPSIPSDPTAYATWLAKKREDFEKRHRRLETYLSFKRLDSTQNPQQYLRVQDSKVQTSYSLHDNDNLPTFSARDLEETHGCWDYIVNLDREVLTINHGAHMSLNQIGKAIWNPHGQIPTDSWIHAIVEKTPFGDTVLLPGVAQGYATDIVWHAETLSAQGQQVYNSLPVTIVKPKGLSDIPTSQGQAYCLYAKIFQQFRETYQETICEQLLSLSPRDFFFREIAYAILCIATAGQNLELVDAQKVIHSDDAGYSDIFDCHLGIVKDVDVNPLAIHPVSHRKFRTNQGTHNNHEDTGPEFVAHFGTGSHLEGNEPGSSPLEQIYMFSGTLICLTAQLTRPGVIADKISKIIHSRDKNRIKRSMNALLISIEHIVLISISGSNQVSHTAPLPLFNLHHTSTTASARYPSFYLSAMEQQVIMSNDRQMAMKKRHATEMEAVMAKTRVKKCRKSLLPADTGPFSSLKKIHEQEWEEEMKKDVNEKKAIARRYKEWKKTNKHLLKPELGPALLKETFISLCHFLDVSARQHLKHTQGIFPTELYETILRGVTDLKTHRACTNVSALFRALCHQKVILTSDWITPLDDTSLKEGTAMMFESGPVTGREKLLSLEVDMRVREMNGCRVVVSGNEAGKRSLLRDMNFTLMRRLR